MGDLIFVVVVVAFFALSVAYVKGCERIVGRDTGAELPGDADAATLRVNSTRPSGERGDHRQHRGPGSRRVDRGLPGRRPRVPGEVLMSTASWLQFVVLIALVGVTAPFIGRYMARVYDDSDRPAPGDRFFLRIERPIYRICRVDPEPRAALDRLRLLRPRVQRDLVADPLPAAAHPGLAAVQPHRHARPLAEHLSFNTAVSFMTNTNWQSYGGESTMSHLTPDAGAGGPELRLGGRGHGGLGGVHPRAWLAGGRRRSATSGSTSPAPPCGSCCRCASCSPRPGQPGRDPELPRLHRGHHRRGRYQQVIPGGPVASQIAIKQLGTNGGGFFNTNSAHPFENTTPFNNFVETYAIVIIPFALAFTYGHMVKDRRQGRAVFAIMVGHLAGHVVGGHGPRDQRQPRARRRSAPIRRPRPTRPAATWRARRSASARRPRACGRRSTTGTSNGSVNSMHDSFTPLGGGVPLAHMMLGEVSPGGVGVGLNGLLIMAILSVFIAGLMVGRTPEYLGKKIQAPEMKMVVLYVLAMPSVAAGLRRRIGAARLGAERHLQPGPARAYRDPLRLHVGVQQQRLGVRRPDDGDPVVRHDARHRHAGRPVLPHHPRAGHRRLAGPQADRARRPPAPSPRTRRCSAGWSSASSSSSPA